MENKTYHQQKSVEYTLRLRELLDELPSFLTTYFRGIEQTTEPYTRIAYAQDLRTFFGFIKENNPLYKDTPMHDLPVDLLDRIKSTDIEEFLEYVKVYQKDAKLMTNNDRAMKRKLSALRSMYRYFYKNEMVKEDPVLLVDMPKIHDKAIVRLDVNEVAELLDVVESGNKLTRKQKEFHERDKVRDLALMTLLLGTGIRVSECVGLDLTDVDFDNDRIKVTRKGGYESYVYFGKEVRDALLSYLPIRKKQPVLEGHENALFISARKTRLGVRSVELMVKKYSKTVTTLKKITPHKLRSTYGTSLYQETGDIYLVADVLGHRDVNTTKKHYAAVEEERRRSAKDKVKLREE